MSAVRNILIIALFVFAAIGSVRAADPTYTPHPLAPSLRAQAEAAMGRGEYSAAAPLFERWLQDDPRDSNAWYNLACIYAQDGTLEKALDAFERSVDAGFTDDELPLRDRDLEYLRTQPRFVAAVARIKEMRKARAPADYLARSAPMRSQGVYAVMLPPDYETSKRTYPLVLILHGSGSTELLHGKLADRMGRKDVIYAAVRAPYTAMELAIGSGQPAYTAWPEGGGVSDDTARIDYAAWIVDVAAQVQKEFRVGPGKFFIWGHSQGGHFATLTALLYPERVGGYFSLAGSEVPDEWFTPARLNAWKTQGLAPWLVHGVADPTVPVAVSRELADRLKKAGITTSLHTIDGTHGVNENMVKLGQMWLADVVKP